MQDDAPGLGKSARALEDSFFAKENGKLLEKLRAQARRERKREVLRGALKIDDDRVLDHLVDLDLSPEAIVAFSLVPLVEVAWAEGSIQEKERDAILRAAEERGVAPDSVSHMLLENWLRKRPDARLLEVWRHYARALFRALEPDERTMMRQRSQGCRGGGGGSWDSGPSRPPRRRCWPTSSPPSTGPVTLRALYWGAM